MNTAGTGSWGRAVLLIQLVGLVLAFAFGLFEGTGLLGRESIVYNVTDPAWPLSKLWMMLVGVSVIRAKRLSGWQRFVSLMCPLGLPLAVVGATAGEALRPYAQLPRGAGTGATA